MSEKGKGSLGITLWKSVPIWSMLKKGNKCEQCIKDQRYFTSYIIQKGRGQNGIFGYDRVLNGHISSTVSIFLSLYTKLFNLIFYTGVIGLPDEWLTGIVKPIFNKTKVTLRNLKTTVQLHCKVVLASFFLFYANGWKYMQRI